MIEVTVVGARGYLGREAVRLLLAHPEVGHVNAVSQSGADGDLGDRVPAFRNQGLPLVGPDARVLEGADVVFMATSSGQAARIVQDIAPEHDTLVVDLSRDHRLRALQGGAEAAATANASATATAATATAVAHAVGGTAPRKASGTAAEGTADGWTFGLPETLLAPQRGDRRIANPGCYPTAALLSVLPAVQSGIASRAPIVVDGKSGVSGAGATPRPDLHFPETNENLRAYKVVGHDHEAEIQAAVDKVAAGDGGSVGNPVRFTPHLVPMNRGLLTTSYVPVKEGVTVEDARAVYKRAYADADTVDVVDEPATAHLRGTVRAEIGVDLDARTGFLVVRAAIDNLVKGGSGQGVHNMNIALGVEPLAGLPLIGGGP